jgi:hypothetical protein
VLGIVIGVMTAICIASLLTGLRQNIVAMIEEYGTNNIYAFHLSTGPRTSEDRSNDSQTADVADAEAIKAQAPRLKTSPGRAERRLRRWAIRRQRHLPGPQLSLGKHAGRLAKLRRRHEHRSRRPLHY